MHADDFPQFDDPRKLVDGWVLIQVRRAGRTYRDFVPASECLDRANWFYKLGARLIWLSIRHNDCRWEYERVAS